METATMEGVTTGSGVQQIGEMAGAVWHALHDHGPLTLARLVKQIGGNRDLVMQGVGWLAREGKVEIEDRKRRKVLRLKEG